MKHLLLLHGALGSSADFELLQAQLSSTFHIHTLDFSGHGKTAFTGSFSIALFADEVIAYLNKQKITSCSIFGYSMGGYVGLYMALHFPERINAVITLGSKLYWTQEIAAKEVSMLDTEKILTKVPVFAEALQQRHSAMDWKELMKETAAMMVGLGSNNALGTDDYKKINKTVLLLLGDRDKMVTREETITAYQCIPSAQMGMLPGTPHAFDRVYLPLLQIMISNFSESIPV